MSEARCHSCQEVIEHMRSRGFTYTARWQDGGPWEVAFLGSGVSRSYGATLHEAIRRAALAAPRPAGEQP